MCSIVQTQHDVLEAKFLEERATLEGKIDNPKGFKLDFFFETNPFFKNSILTNTYHMIDEDEPILEKAISPLKSPKDEDDIDKEVVKTASLAL
nr:nucleosome assembly protein 1;2-like isoform X1 [Ipomoea batatas]